ncbi:MAG: hypothetical protein PHG83_03650 [Patescibacteria group bacterium]|nr:hypothetical protein [Patescibacteria group bacterium]
MTLKKYLNLMTILTIICWLAWVAVIIFINPRGMGLIGFILFYFSLFLAILGAASLLGFIVRTRLNLKPIFVQVELAFRQGIWLGLVIVSMLILKGLDLLRWWNFLFLVLFFVVLEFFFLSSQRKYKV